MADEDLSDEEYDALLASATARQRSLSRSAAAILSTAVTHPLDRRVSASSSPPLSAPIVRMVEDYDGRPSNAIEWIRRDGDSSESLSSHLSGADSPSSSPSPARNAGSNRMYHARENGRRMSQHDSLGSFDSSDAELGQTAAADIEEQLFAHLDQQQPVLRRQMFVGTKKFVRNLLRKRIPPEDQLDEITIFLQDQAEAVHSTPMWSADRLVEKQLVVELRNYLFRKLFKSIVLVTKPEDDALVRRLMKMQPWLQLRNLDIPEECWNDDLWFAAKQEFERMPQMSTPAEKLACVLNCCKILVCMLEESGSYAGADDFLPLLVFLIVKSNLPQLQSNIYFIQDYSDGETMDGENECFFTHLMSAITFLRVANAKQFNMDQHEFDKYMDDAPKSQWKVVKQLLSIDKSPNKKGSKRDALKHSRDSPSPRSREGPTPLSREASFETPVGSLADSHHSVGSNSPHSSQHSSLSGSSMAHLSSSLRSSSSLSFMSSPSILTVQQATVAAESMHRSRSSTDPIRHVRHDTVRVDPKKLEPHVSFNLPSPRLLEEAEEQSVEASAEDDRASLDESIPTGRPRADSFGIEPAVTQELSKRFPFFGRTAQDVTPDELPELIRAYRELALLVYELVDKPKEAPAKSKEPKRSTPKRPK